MQLFVNRLLIIFLCKILKGSGLLQLNIREAEENNRKAEKIWIEPEPSFFALQNISKNACRINAATRT